MFDNILMNNYPLAYYILVTVRLLTTLIFATPNRRFSRPRFSSSSVQEESSITKKAKDESDDNWEYYDVNIP